MEDVDHPQVRIKLKLIETRSRIDSRDDLQLRKTLVIEVRLPRRSATTFVAAGDVTDGSDVVDWIHPRLATAATARAAAVLGLDTSQRRRATPNASLLLAQPLLRARAPLTLLLKLSPFGVQRSLVPIRHVGIDHRRHNCVNSHRERLPRNYVLERDQPEERVEHFAPLFTVLLVGETCYAMLMLASNIRFSPCTNIKNEGCGVTKR